MKRNDLFVNDEGLVIAMYVSAAEDYVEAIICDNALEERMNRKFLTSGDFGISKETGEFIVAKLPEEVSIARNICNSFLASKDEKYIVNQRKVVPWVLQMLVNIKYKHKLKVKLEEIGNSKVYYLVKKAIKNGVTNPFKMA